MSKNNISHLCLPITALFWTGSGYLPETKLYLTHPSALVLVIFSCKPYDCMCFLIVFDHVRSGSSRFLPSSHTCFTSSFLVNGSTKLIECSTLRYILCCMLLYSFILISLVFPIGERYSVLDLLSLSPTSSSFLIQSFSCSLRLYLPL